MATDKELPEWCYRENERIRLSAKRMQTRIDEYDDSADQNDEARATLLGKCLASKAEIFLLLARWSFFVKVSRMDDFDARLENEAAQYRRKRIAVPVEVPQQTITIAFVDTETTGLTDLDEPISVAAVLAVVNLKTGKLTNVITEYHGRREPSCDISPKAQSIHGVRKEELKGLQFDMLELVTIFASADIAIAHNAQFDCRMLHGFVGHLNVQWGCSCRDVNWPTSSRSLDAVCDHLEIVRPIPHDAMADTRAMMAALQADAGDGITYLGCLLQSKNITTSLSQRVHKKYGPRPAVTTGAGE